MNVCKWISEKILITFVALLPHLCYAQTDYKEDLSMAMEYFGGQKYHEAMLKFEALNKIYELNPRFMSYLGVCHYKEQNYERAVEILDESIQYTAAYPPLEQALYNFSAAESHFAIAQNKENGDSVRLEYLSASKYYAATLTLCHGDDKGDVLFRLGFCNLFCDSINAATECFAQALDLYNAMKYLSVLQKNRRNQIRKMLKKLLVTHGASRMDVGNKETWYHENQHTNE